MDTMTMGTETAESRIANGIRLIFINRFFYPDLSATSQILFDLTQRLVKRGYSVHVLCSRQLYSDAGARLRSYEVVEGVNIHRVAGTRFGRDNLIGRSIDYVSFYVTSFLKMFWLVKRNDIVIAKTDPPLISVFAALMARITGAKLINWLQDLFPEVLIHLHHRTLPSWMDSYLRWLRNRSLKRADTNIVIGERMKQRVISLGIGVNRVTVIENWSDSNFITAMAPALSRLRAELELRDHFVVGYSGNMGRAHEYQTILSAALVLRDRVDIVFLMIGGGARMQQLKAAVVAASLSNFIFLPYQSRESLADSMAAADVHLINLLPSMEGLIVPSKFYGILAAGRPTIAIGDVDGEVASIVKAERCGSAVAVGDHVALVAEINRLKSSAELRESQGRRAHQLFLSKYTVDQAVLLWIEALKNVRSGTASNTLKAPEQVATG